MIDAIERQKIFKEVTEKILKERKLGSVFDINNGVCDVWAEEVRKRIPEAECMDTPLEEWETENWAVGHVWVMIDGVHYDAETIEGVRDWRDLAIFKRNRK